MPGLPLVRGLDRFEARSSLKRWISSIVVNSAKTQATRERRSIPFSAVWIPARIHSIRQLSPSAFGTTTRHNGQGDGCRPT